MNEYRAELHLHTVLSACAELEMIPPLILEIAAERGINLLAVTDHNTTANCPAVMAAGASMGISVLPGMELQTQEEVHLLCLFDSLEQAANWQCYVDEKLPKLKNRPEFFGDQLVVDQTGDFIRREERLLAVSAQISLEEAISEVTRLGGLAIPAHVDRKSNGLIAVLGIVPRDAGIEALEISSNISPDLAASRYPQTNVYPILWGGDAHTLDAITGKNIFSLESPTISEIRLALAGINGRSLRLA